MEPTSVIDDDVAEFWLPPEFLTDEDFLLEKENNGGGNENRRGFGSFELKSGFGSTVKSNGDEENFLTGFTRPMVHSTLEDDFSAGFGGYEAFPVRSEYKAWGTNRSLQSTLCVDGIGCGCRRNQRSNQNYESRVSSPAKWDLYCVAAEEMASMNINDDCNNLSSRTLFSPPTKLTSVAATATATAAKIPNNFSAGYYNQQSLQYQKLQAIQFQRLKEQQLMKFHRQMVQQSRGGLKNGGQVDLSSSFAWSNKRLPRRGDIGGSGMRAVFLGDHAGKRGSTGTGVFLPQPITSRVTADTLKKPAVTTVLIPARVAQVLSENEVWRQQSNNGGFMGQMMTEQPLNEPRLPPDWVY